MGQTMLSTLLLAPLWLQQTWSIDLLSSEPGHVIWTTQKNDQSALITRENTMQNILIIKPWKIMNGLAWPAEKGR